MPLPIVAAIAPIFVRAAAGAVAHQAVDHVMDAFTGPKTEPPTP